MLQGRKEQELFCPNIPSKPAIAPTGTGENEKGTPIHTRASHWRRGFWGWEKIKTTRRRKGDQKKQNLPYVCQNEWRDEGA